MAPTHPAHEGGRPVFVVGSARSGNTLLYHTLLSAGGFAIYRGEPAVFDLLAPDWRSQLCDRPASIARNMAAIASRADTRAESRGDSSSSAH